MLVLVVCSCFVSINLIITVPIMPKAYIGHSRTASEDFHID